MKAKTDQKISCEEFWQKLSFISSHIIENLFPLYLKLKIIKYRNCNYKVKNIIFSHLVLFYIFYQLKYFLLILYFIQKKNYKNNKYQKN